MVTQDGLSLGGENAMIFAGMQQMEHWEPDKQTEGSS